MKPRPTAIYGFTLIELMISAVLVAMMGVLIMASIHSSVVSKDSAEKLSQRFQEGNQAIARMSREISMAYLSKNFNSTDPSYLTQFKGKKDSLFFSAFGHVVHQKDAKESDEQVLGYYLAPDKQGNQALMRRMHPDLNTDVEHGGRSQVLCPNVTKLEFSYYDNNLDQWLDTWLADPTMQPNTGNIRAAPKGEGKTNDATKSWRLPSIVKITMTVLLEENREMTWMSMAEIAMQDPLDLN
jgi:general secretion pathway protein J